MTDKIHVLRGADRVRKRPAVIFGSQGREGAETAVRMLLEIFATEAMLGHCSCISVTREKEQITVHGDDRGLYLGQDLDQPREVWESVFCQIYPSPRSGPEEQEYHFHFFDPEDVSSPDAPEGVFLPDTYGTNDLCLLQYASGQMHVTAVRDGVCGELDFRCGEPVGDLRRRETADKNGTTISFCLDREVFSDTDLSDAFLVERMREYAMLIPGLQTHYVNGSAEAFFCFREGIAGDVQEFAPAPYGTIFSNRICAQGRDRYNRRPYQATVEAALCFVPQGGVQRCYHNLRHLQAGGTHLQEMKAMICRQLNTCFGAYLEEQASGAWLQEHDLEDHLYLLVDTRCSRFSTQWETGTRQSICNIMIRDMAQDLLREAFSNYLHKNKAQLQALVDSILETRATR